MPSISSRTKTPYQPREINANRNLERDPGGPGSAPQPDPSNAEDNAANDAGAQGLKPSPSPTVKKHIALHKFSTPMQSCFPFWRGWCFKVFGPKLGRPAMTLKLSLDHIWCWVVLYSKQQRGDTTETKQTIQPKWLRLPGLDPGSASGSLSFIRR